ncbi:MAG: hypothetical protein HYT70_00960 [Candidatus Aenigmarchaeota archaeon]|nr:hypothetical protein [Candidatus Aenigmarchaeota archaeon]
MLNKRKGYRVERKIKLLLEKHGWTVVRAGASLGVADLISIKNKKCILLQIKSTNKNTLYYYGYDRASFEGFPFYLVVDFGYGKIRVMHPKKVVGVTDGVDFNKFLR